MRISNDVFDVDKRLKEIDKRYYIDYNTLNNTYELHLDGGHRNYSSFVMTLPFERLDSRIVEYVRKTRIERSAHLIKEIDEYNAKVEKDAFNHAKEQVREKVEFSVSMLSKTNV